MSVKSGMTVVVVSAVVGMLVGCASLQNPPTYEAAVQLLDKGHDVNSPDEHGITPLHNVARHWGTDAEAAKLVGLYLERGANPNARDKGGQSPLFGCYDGRPLVVQALLAGGTDPFLVDNKGLTAIESVYRRLYEGRQQPIAQVAFIRLARDADAAVSQLVPGCVVMPALRITDTSSGAILYNGPQIVANNMRAIGRGAYTRIDPLVTSVQVLPGDYEIALVPVAIVAAGGPQQSVVGAAPGKAIVTTSRLGGGTRYTIHFHAGPDTQTLTLSAEPSVGR